MKLLQKIGLALFIVAMIIFTLSLGFGKYKLDRSSIEIIGNEYHQSAIFESANQSGVLNKEFSSNIDFIKSLKETFNLAQSKLNSSDIPQGVSEWDYKIGDWKKKEYLMPLVKASTIGYFKNNTTLFFLLTFGLGIFGGLLFIIPKFNQIPGIKNNQVYQHSYSRGIKANLRNLILYITIVSILLYGVSYMNAELFWPLLTLGIIGLICYLVFYKDNQKELNPPKSASPELTGWIGL